MGTGVRGRASQTAGGRAARRRLVGAPLWGDGGEDGGRRRGGRRDGGPMGARGNFFLSCVSLHPYTVYPDAKFSLPPYLFLDEMSTILANGIGKRQFYPYVKDVFYNRVFNLYFFRPPKSVVLAFKFCSTKIYF